MPAPFARVRGFLGKLGPGLITGASDDDPSGIGTYSIAGAQFGYSTLWTAWFLFPLLASVQLLCARLGLVSGSGLSALLRKRYGGRWLWLSCALLAIANIATIAADLGAMAAAAQMVTGLDFHYFLLSTTFGIGLLLALWPYYRIAQVLKWLTLGLFAYVLAAFRAHVDWGQAMHATLLPAWGPSASFWTTLLALAGTTISPYLFFWQATQEVEEYREKGKLTFAKAAGGTEEETHNAFVDVGIGTLFSQVIMYFIILTTAATLHANGHVNIATTQEAAEALRPAAGSATYLLFTLGIIGTGLLSVPVLAGSTAFAIAEAAGWRNSLRYRPRQAPEFYAVLWLSLGLGMAANYLRVPVVSMLFWSSVLNGVLAPPLLVLVVLLSSDKSVMGNRMSSPLFRAIAWITVVVISAGVLVMAGTAIMRPA